MQWNILLVINLAGQTIQIFNNITLFVIVCSSLRECRKHFGFEVLTSLTEEYCPQDCKALYLSAYVFIN
jgi:hypothetical protein